MHLTLSFKYDIIDISSYLNRQNLKIASIVLGTAANKRFLQPPAARQRRPGVIHINIFKGVCL